jgi:hypothetical protein
MCKIIDDFIQSANRMNGFGYFEGDLIAFSFAQSISKNQKRKYQRYQIIPASFFNYLEKIGAIKREKFIPDKNRTLGWLLDLLSETANQNTKRSSEAEMLRTEILKDLHPELKKAMGSAQHIWKKLESDGKVFGLKSV